MKQRITLVKIVYDLDYIEALKEREKGGSFKAMAFLFYLHNLEVGLYESTRYYANVWGVSNSTSWAWLKEFDQAIGD